MNRMIFAHRLDHAFRRFGAGIAEKHQIGKARSAQAVGQFFLFGDAVKIGDVPKFFRLRL